MRISVMLAPGGGLSRGDALQVALLLALGHEVEFFDPSRLPLRGHSPHLLLVDEMVKP